MTYDTLIQLQQIALRNASVPPDILEMPMTNAFYQPIANHSNVEIMRIGLHARTAGMFVMMAKLRRSVIEVAQKQI